MDEKLKKGVEHIADEMLGGRVCQEDGMTRYDVTLDELIQFVETVAPMVLGLEELP